MQNVGKETALKSWHVNQVYLARQGLEAGRCKQGSETFGSIKTLELFDKLRNLNIMLAFQIGLWFIRLISTYEYTSGKCYRYDTERDILQRICNL